MEKKELGELCCYWIGRFYKKDDDYKELEILHSQQDEDLERLKTENLDLVRQLQNAKTNQRYQTNASKEKSDDIRSLKSKLFILGKLIFPLQLLVCKALLNFYFRTGKQ